MTWQVLAMYGTLVAKSAGAQRAASNSGVKGRAD
jgi:hypothetical protein